MAAYQYTPLDTSTPTIRVLVLKAGPWNLGIQCELRERALIDQPSYEALSYCWGPQTNLKPISLHGCAHRVTVNLEAALRHLRSEDVDRVLWVDALCINQQDLDEREKQVEKMYDIYKAATRVVAWTGEATEDSNVAIKLIQEFGSFSQNLWNGKYDDVIADIDGTDAGFQARSEILEMFGVSTSTEIWNSLWKFFDRPYWERIWIIQELFADGLLDKSRGIIMCGKAIVERVWYDYTCTTLVTTIMASSSRFQANSFTLDEPMRSLALRGHHPPGITMFQTICGCQYNASRGLAFLIRATKRFQATDSRDKIYAVLGLTPKRSKEFPVVYEEWKPLKNVLMHLVEFLIEEDKNLNILLGNRSLKERVGASWLPELTAHCIYDMWIPGHFQLQASARIPPDVSFDSTCAILRARGIMVGTLELVIEGPSPATTELANTTTTIELISSTGGVTFMSQLISFTRSLMSDGETETLWRTLVLDHDSSDINPEYPAPNDFGTMFEAAYCQGSGPESARTGTQEALSIYEFTSPFIKSMEKCVNGRCFFTTTDGGMGIGPSCAQSGDVVVMLYGGDCLFVLREVGERYELIGDAYVHGFMHGELTTESSMKNSRVFELE